MNAKRSRRDVLKYGLLGGGALLLPAVLQRSGHQPNAHVHLHGLAHSSNAAGLAASPSVKRFEVPLPIPPVLTPQLRDGFDYYEITMREVDQQILPGLTTRVWCYNGIVPGPTIKARKGRSTMVRFINRLPEAMAVHNHGMASLPQYDGYAEDLIPTNYSKEYIYPNNRPATLWYHDHAVHKTAEHVYRGLAGFYIVQDSIEDELALPAGDYDVPLVIRDAQFGNDGRLIFDDGGHDSLMGDTILVNGAPWPRMQVRRRKYRFRILNGSISRAYRLALDSKQPLIVIGTDGGLLPAPVTTPNLRLGGAERYEVVIDFSVYAVGTKVILRNQGLPNNLDLSSTRQIMLFEVVDGPTGDDPPLPPALRDDNPVMALDPSKAVRRREWRFGRKNGMWTINDRVWDKRRVDANPGLNDVEIWTFRNSSGGWNHPIHTHLVDFRILDRNGKPPFRYEGGPKDTAYVGENEEVRVVLKAGPHLGKYMLHCHNVVHEDHDMMVQFEVGSGGPDPVTTAPPLSLPPLS